MGEQLTWYAAMEMLRDDPEARAQNGRDLYRMRGTSLEVSLNGSEPWSVVTPCWPSLMVMIWRRVPKTPSLHELAAKWRATAADEGGVTLRRCASDLDAVLREGDYVSLKGVTAQKMWEVWYGNSNCVRGMDDVLAYLRSRGAK